MDIADELVKVEVEKILNEKIKEYIIKIIDDFNAEGHGVEIDTIKMENLSYVISVNDKKIIF